MARSKEDKAHFISSLRESAKALEGKVDIPFSLLEQFSPNNCLAILSQRPSATSCAGFHAWRSAGRSVRKGAKGIAILIPIGTQEEGERPLFSWRYVFDITDTEPLGADQGERVGELVNA